jgi:lactate permease
MIWSQNYDPFGVQWLSTAVAALPVVVLLGLVALGHIRVWMAALLGLATALAVALFAFKMPASAAFGSALYGAGYGLFPIGWIVLNVMFLHTLTVQSGRFELLRTQLTRLAPDRRVQLILVAYAFGGFIEGSAGFGAPVAITAAMLMQLGFAPIRASAMALLANTAPVAFGSVGIPITTLAQVTGLDVLELSKMAGRQLPVFSLMIPFWIVVAYGGWRALAGVWPAALVAGGSFASVQFLVSNFHGPWLVDTAAGLASIVSLVALLRFWQPRDQWTPPEEARPEADTPTVPGSTESALAPNVPTALARSTGNPWVPWLLLAGVLFLWGVPAVKKSLDGISAPSFPVAGLHQQVVRVPPVVEAVVAKPEEALFKLNWISATGSGILLAGILAGFWMGFSPREMIRTYAATAMRVRSSLVTIAAMLALGNVTKYSGADATLGLALAGTGPLYPFFGTLLGWLGVALTGSDTASNVLFGGLQKITSQQLGLNPYVMCAANSVGGVMGKMIDAQSIVVAGVATRVHGQEGKILRAVFGHSIALAALVGLLVTVMAQ